MNRIPVAYSRLYNTYLKGVPVKQFLATLGAFYTLVATVLSGIGVAKQTTAYVAVGLTCVAALIYLIIPKDKQPLFDNLVREAANDPELATKIIAAGVQLASLSPKPGTKGASADADTHQ